MRFAVFVFALTLIFSTTLAHAMPLLAVPRAVGAIWSFGGKVVKIASSRTMLATVGTAGMIGYQPAVAYCKKNPKKCKDILGDASEFFFEDDDTNSDNDNFVCDGVVIYNSYQGGGGKKSGSYLAHAKNNFYDYAINLSKSNAPDKEPLDPNFRLDGEPYEINGILNQIVRYDHYNFWGGQTSSIIQVYKYCDTSQKPEPKETEINTKQEQAKKVIQNLSDDDITYIINNYGDQINVGQYCSDNSCDELELSFAEEVKKNQDKYDIDKINSQNCTVKNKKIVSCKKAHKDQLEFDFEQETEEENTNIDTDIEQKKEDEDPTICDTSDITREACEFFDWVDDEAEEPKDTKVDIEDPEESGLDEEMINVMKECPADMQFTITMLGKTMNFKLSTMPFCLVAEKIRPYLLSAGSLSALFILAGIKRD